jgi:hypothetical protein
MTGPVALTNGARSFSKPSVIVRKPGGTPASQCREKIHQWASLRRAGIGERL